MVLGKNPSTEKNSPDPKPNSIPNLTLTVLLNPHGGGGGFFPGGFFPDTINCKDKLTREFY